MHFITFERVSTTQLEKLTNYFEPLSSYCLLLSNTANGKCDVKIACVDTSQYILNCFKEEDLKILREILHVRKLHFES
ncbi:MAG: hypothetical protein M3O67_07420 [Bacteroidota bacterium]|nr:hypothetical protein [Bacteroidota bacterium]